MIQIYSFRDKSSMQILEYVYLINKGKCLQNTYEPFRSNAYTLWWPIKDLNKIISESKIVEKMVSNKWSYSEEVEKMIESGEIILYFEIESLLDLKPINQENYPEFFI